MSAVAGISYTLSCGCEGVHRPGDAYGAPSRGASRYCTEHKHSSVAEVAPLPHPFRPEPPELEFPPPLCSVCEGDLENDGDGWYCHSCEVSWSSDGRGGSYDEPTESACQSVIEPFNRDDLSPEHESIRHNREQCIKVAGHEGDHTSGPWFSDQWKGSDPRVVHPADDDREDD